MALDEPCTPRRGALRVMLAAGIALVAQRFRAAIQACWYPIKHRAPVRAFHDALRESGVRDIIA